MNNAAIITTVVVININKYDNVLPLRDMRNGFMFVMRDLGEGRGVRCIVEWQALPLVKH